MQDYHKTPMPILSQLIPTILALYWSILADFFTQCFYASMLERCRNHLLVKLAKHLDFTQIEAACAAYRHSQGAGAPATYPISVLVRCVLVGFLEGLSFRELEHRLYSDMLVRWFVGLSAFEEVPDHSTLERFDLWVRTNHRNIYHRTVLKQIDDMFPQSSKLNQIGDTYAMLANAAKEDLVPRLRHAIIILLDEARQAMPNLLTPTVSRFPWHKLFGAPKERPVFCLNEKEKRQRLESAILAAHDLHQRFTTTLQSHASQEYPDVRLWLGYLGKILHDEVVILAEPAPDGTRVHIRTTKERRNDPETTLRIGSATDIEATFRMHGDEDEDVTLGYNIQVAASKDGFVRVTQAYTGAVPDQTGVAALIAVQIEQQGTCPPKLLYDMAAGNGKTRAEVDQVSDGKTQLIAKQIPYDKRTERFGPYDFVLSEDGKFLTCPNGKTSEIAYRSGSGDGRNFRFCACQCWLNGEPPKRMKEADLSLRCPFWEKCRDSRNGPGAMRQVFISDYRDYVLAANEYNLTEAFQVEIKQRPLIERIIFELTHYNGARRCRGRGLVYADWQATMCAVAYNLKLWMRRI